jgi:hypothetical protein
MNMGTGGPAFPVGLSAGMTLRDYFAAKAMEGVLSRPTAGLLDAEDIAPAVYRMADAMLKARSES